MGKVPVYFFKGDRADEYDPLLWTDKQGRFELHRLDCPCDFPIELVAIHPDFGIGRYTTTHDALEREDAKPIVIQLTDRPKPPEPTPATEPPNCSSPDTKDKP
jgi:hypothetical protein